MSRSRTTRRGFLKGATGLVAAGAITPYVWPSNALRAEAKNDRLGVAAIGVGGRGTGIGRQAGSLGDMVAVCDVDRSAAERFSGFFGGKLDVVTDYRKILDRKDVDVVTIGTPDHWHTKICIEAMQAGKDVYCEKPLTLTIEEGKQITKVTRETGRIFQVGTQQRTEDNRMFLKAVVIARSGRLGKNLHAISSVGGATSGGPFPTQDPPSHLDWDMWLGQAPKVPFSPNRIGWNFRWWFEYSGGQVTDWGVHHTDIGLWALGGEDTGPVEIEGEGQFPIGRELTRDALLGRTPFEELPVSYNVARSFDCTMKLPNGNTIQLTSGPNDLTIRGEDGELKVNRGRIEGKVVSEIENDPQQREWLDQEVRKLYRDMPLQNHMYNFFWCVQNQALPISDVYTHVNSVNCCHMANIAMLLGRKVTWDVSAQRFVGDDEANALTRRKQRAPYTIDVKV